MNQFPNLTDPEIDAILGYINSVPAPGAAAGGTAAAAEGTAESGDNTLLFGILTLILAIVALILLQVNSNLKKLSDEKEGQPALEPLPFWRNKAYIALVAILLFCIGGYLTVTGAIGLGRTKGYYPSQPIYYSHKVHAGTNQISCLYCHGGAQESKHANIPSVNICMNCHNAIKRESPEIQKIYTAIEQNKPIEWVRVHNLPDFAYFNHAQHVNVGGVQCQQCHGEIQTMEVVEHRSSLTMGWCIDCHRKTNVNTGGNAYYDKLVALHKQNNSKEELKVMNIGGLECSKCHY